MAWKYCDGDFSQRSPTPRDSSRIPNVRVHVHATFTRAHTPTRSVSVSPARECRTELRQEIYATPPRARARADAGFTVSRSSCSSFAHLFVVFARCGCSKVTNALTHACHRYSHWFFPTKIRRACNRAGELSLLSLRREKRQRTYESNRLARRGRRASLPYVVHGKRRRSRRSRFPSTLATVFAWLTESREKEITLNRGWKHGRQSFVLFVPIRVLINVVAALITVAANLISSVILDFPPGSSPID